MIIVFGATGKVGRHVAPQPAERGVAARAVSRTPDRVRGDAPDGIEYVHTDLTEPAILDRVLDGLDQVFLVGPDSTVGLDRAHYHAEQALEAAGLARTHLRPSYSMQNLLLQAASGTIALPFGDARTNLVDTRDIAAVAVAALTTDGHAGQAYPVTGPQALTFTEVAATLTEATGRTFTYHPVSRQPFADTLQQWGLPARSPSTWPPRTT